MSNLTTSQTIGPFPHEAWKWAVDATASTDNATAAIRIHGVIIDGDNTPINDGWAEAWLPDSMAAESAQALPGYRRMSTDEAGSFAFTISASQIRTGKPVAYITVFARGLLKHQFTAIFLEDDPALAQSALLEQVPAARRNTLIARKQDDGSYRWDIHMQGDNETVFFDYE